MMEPPPVTTTFTVVAPTHDPLDHQHLPPIKTTFPTTTGATTDRYKNSMHQESVGRSDLMGEMSPPAMLLMNAPPGGGSSGGSLSTRPSAQQGHLQQGITMNVVSRRQPPPSGHQHLHKNHFSSTQMNNSTTSSTKAGTKYYRDQTQHFIAVAEAVKNPNYLQRQRNLHNMQQEELSMISSLAAGSSAVPGGAAGGGGAPLPNYKRYPRSFEAALSGDASGGNDANYVRGAGAKGGPTKKGKKVKHIPVVSAAHDAQVDRLTQEIEDFLEARADGRASLPSGDVEALDDSAPEPPESAEIIARTEELVRLAETARQAVDNERRKKEQGGLVRNRRNMFKGAKGKAEAGASESEDGEEDGTSTSNVYRGDTSCTGNVTAGEETESTAGEIDLPHAGEPQDPRVEEQEQSRDDSKDEQDGLLEEFLKGAERLAASMSNELDKFEDSSNNDEDGQEDASAGASDDEDEQRSKSSSDTTTSTSTTGFKNSKKSSSSISATATQKIKDELRKKLPDLHANKDFVVPVGLTEPEPKVFPIPSDFALLGDVQDPSDPVVEAFRPFDSWKLEKQKRDEEEQKERLFREARAKLEEIRVERGDLDFSNFLGAEEPSMSGGGDVDFSTLMNTSKAATELMLNMKASSTSMAAAEKNSSTRSGGAAGARSCRAALSTTRTSTSTSRRNSGSAGTVYGNTLSATASAVRTAVDGRDHCLRGGGSSRRVQEHKGSSTSSRDHGTSIFREVDQHHGVGHGAGQSSTLGGAGAQIMESSAGFTIMRVPGTDPRNRNLETDSSMAIHHDQNNGEDGAVLFMQDNYAGRKRTPGVDGHKRRDDHERFFDSSSRQDEAALSEGIPHIDQLCDGYRHMKTASCSRTTLTSNIKDKNDVLSRTSSKEHQNRSSSTSRGQARSGGSAASGSSLGGNSMGAAAASSSSKGRNQSRAGGSSTTSDTLATTALSSRNRKASKAASEIEAAPVNSSVQRFYEAVRFGNVNVVRIMLNEISGHLKVDEYSRMAAASEAIFAGVEAQKGYAMTEFLLRNGFNPNVRAGANAGGAAVKVQTNPKNTRGTKETNSLLGMVTPGETPIITCVKKKIRHGTNSAWTSDRDSLGILKLLVAHAADVNARCSLTGRTALWYAGKFNNRPAVEALLELGADPRIPDRRQHMPGDVTTNSEVDVLLQRALAKWQQSQVFRVAAKKAAQDVAGGASMLSSTAGNTRGEGGGRERSARGAANTTGAHTSDSLDEDSSAVSRSTSDTRKDTHNLPGLAPVFDLECEILLRERRVEDLRNRKGIKIVDFPEHAPICIVKVMRDDIAGLEALCTCEVSKEKFVVRGPSGELLVDRRGGRVAALREQDLEF